MIVQSNQSRKCYKPRLMTSTLILIISDISKTENQTKDKQTVARETLENQRKTIVNSWVRCLENNQLVITSGFPTVNFRK